MVLLSSHKTNEKKLQSRQRLKISVSNYPVQTVVQLLMHVQLFAALRTAAHHAFLFLTISWSLPKLMAIESVMPSNHLILCLHLSLIFPFQTDKSPNSRDSQTQLNIATRTTLGQEQASSVGFILRVRQRWPQEHWGSEMITLATLPERMFALS